MSQNLWDIPASVAPVEELTIHVTAAVETVEDDNTNEDWTKTTRRTLSVDFTKTLSRALFDWPAFDTAGGEFDRRDTDEFVVIRIAPGLLIADPFRLQPTTVKTVKTWIANTGEFNAVTDLGRSVISDASEPARLAVQFFVTPNPEVSVEETYVAAPGFTGTLPPDDSYTEEVTVRARAQLVRSGTTFQWALELSSGFAGIYLPGATDLVLSHTTAGKAVNISTLQLVGGGLDFGDEHTWEFVAPTPPADVTYPTWDATYSLSVAAA